MIENNNKLNDEQLKEVAGGQELEPGIRDDASYLLEECLILKKSFFEHYGDIFSDIHNLHNQIERAYTSKNSSLRIKEVSRSLKLCERLLNNPLFVNDPDILFLKDKLLKVQELIGKPER